MKKDNMYSWITKTRNFIGGECPHRCIYCYVNTLKLRKLPEIQKRYTGELFLIDKELSKREGKGKTIFVQDCGDLFAEAVLTKWIVKVLEHCRDYPENQYLFQTKNPKRFNDFINKFPKGSILATTIESNENYPGLSGAPSQKERSKAMCELKCFPKMISVEPVLDFNLDSFVEMIRKINPKFVSIGADSKGNHLTEPDSAKLRVFINELKKFTEVRIKNNLKRLLNGM